MVRVVLSKYPMIDPDAYRNHLADAVDASVDVDVAELGSTERLIEVASGGDDVEPASAVVTDVKTPVTAEAIDALDLDLVVRSAVGVGNIDVAAADEAGVVVTHVPDYCTDEVATHAVSLLLGCLRSLKPYDDAVTDGDWAWQDGRPIRRVRGATVGLVSFGPIARRVAEQLSGFGVDRLAYDPYVDEAEMAEHDVEKASFAELFDRADHVSVHAPLTEETRGMIDADALARLDADSVLVNTGRGPVVDGDDLADALANDDLKAAGLDVLEQEPPEDDPLVGREDTIVTPHAAWYSEDARDEVNRRGAEQVAAVVTGAEPDGRIDPDAEWL